MNDLLHASQFFCIFAVALVLYGLLMVKTGNKDLIPYRAIHSVRNADDVRRVGRWVLCVGVAIGVLALLGVLVSQ